MFRSYNGLVRSSYLEKDNHLGISWCFDLWRYWVYNIDITITGDESARFSNRVISFAYARFGCTYELSFHYPHYLCMVLLIAYFAAV